MPSNSRYNDFNEKLWDINAILDLRICQKYSILGAMLKSFRTKKTQKPLLVRFSLATIIAVFPGEATAQNLNCIQNLIFGDIITCGAAGTVTVRPDDTTTSSCVTIGGAPLSRARCTVTQSFPFRPIQVNVSAAAVVNDGGGNTMNVNAFNIVTNSGGTSHLAPAVPFLDVPIGATINVGATQAGGTYSGTFGITVVLN